MQNDSKPIVHMTKEEKTAKTERPEKRNGEGSMTEHLGIVFLPDDGEGNTVRAEMPVDHRTSQPFGMLSGGASLALAEMLAGYGSLKRCGKGRRPCGIQVSGNHVSGVKSGGKVIATGTLVHRGQSSHVWNVDVRTPEGRLVSTVRVVNMILNDE